MRTRAKVLKPFRDGRSIWKGLEQEGTRRKLFHLLDVDLHDTKHLVAGLAMFEPGEGAAFHSHPGSEEVNIALKGRGKKPPRGYFRFVFANCFIKNSASTSTRAGRGPPGGVTRCTAPSG